MFERILVTVDGSALGGLALPYAGDLARRYGSRVTVMHVAGEPVIPVDGALRGFDYARELQYLRDTADGVLNEARAALADVPQVETVRREANAQDVAKVICEEVRSGGHDLVVMSTHGRTGLAHLLMGSVAERVLHGVRVPVLLVRAPAVPGSSARRTEEVVK